MRVLLDGNLPRALARMLVAHEVRSVHDESWSDLDNGALLDVTAGKYDALVTLNQSPRFQQNLRGRPLAVLVLRARSNRLIDLEPLVPELLRILPHARVGEATLLPGV